MQRVKSLRAGWVSGWQGTRDGKIYQLQGDSDSVFYKLFDPLRPTPENCPCMRLTPVKLASEPKQKGIKRQVEGAKTGQKTKTKAKPKKLN